MTVIWSKLKLDQARITGRLTWVHSPYGGYGIPKVTVWAFWYLSYFELWIDIEVYEPGTRRGITGRLRPDISGGCPIAYQTGRFGAAFWAFIYPIYGR